MEKPFQVFKTRTKKTMSHTSRYTHFFEENYIKSLEQICQGCANMQGAAEPFRQINTHSKKIYLSRKCDETDVVPNSAQC